MRHADHGEEVFANAVMHGPAGGRVLAGYCLWRAGARLVICDGGGPATPRLVSSGDGDVGGRGLRIVDSLTARRGSFRLAGAQVVWCDLGQPLRAAARRDAGRGGTMNTAFRRARAGRRP